MRGRCIDTGRHSLFGGRPTEAIIKVITIGVDINNFLLHIPRCPVRFIGSYIHGCSCDSTLIIDVCPTNAHRIRVAGVNAGRPRLNMELSICIPCQFRIRRDIPVHSRQILQIPVVGLRPLDGVAVNAVISDDGIGEKVIELL